MRILYSFLKEINDKSLDNGEKLYRMNEYEFRELLRHLYDNGYIKGGIILSDSYSLKSAILTEKGLKVLEEYKSYEEDYPDRDNIKRWIRNENYSYNEEVYKFKKINCKLSKETLEKYLRDFSELILNIKYSKIKLSISEVATISEIKEIENKLGYMLPKEFKKVLSEFSKKVEFYWNIKNNIEIEENNNYKNYKFKEKVTSEICSGGNLDRPLWDIYNLEELEEIKETYKFIDEDNEKSYWSNSMIFQGLGNEDYLGIDLLYNKGEIIILSSNLKLNGYPIANNFISFIKEWFKIGCIGNLDNDFYLLSTINSPYISNKSLNAKKIKEELKNLN